MKLSISNLSKTYSNNVKALNNLNLEIEAGIFGLLGPNGAGKSSLMRTIATLQEPDNGDIQFGKIDILRQKDRLRRVLGYLPQDFGVPARISAEELLHYFAVLKGVYHKKERNELVNSLLEQTNLQDVRKRAVKTFSGGMKQRFGIAQALIGDPQLIIVDEPTAGLDPQERNRFHTILSEIAENRVVILSTHIVEDVADLCNHLAIMNQGSIQLMGKPDDLIKKLKNKIWKIPTKAPQYLQRDPERVKVISTQISKGQQVAHVYCSEPLNGEFQSVDVHLEDVYFTTLASIDY